VLDRRPSSVDLGAGRHLPVEHCADRHVNNGMSLRELMEVGDWNSNQMVLTQSAHGSSAQL